MASASGQTAERQGSGTVALVNETGAGNGGVVRLALRVPEAEKKRVRWGEDVVDNEFLGRKSSKGEAPSFDALRRTFFFLSPHGRDERRRSWMCGGWGVGGGRCR